MYTILYVVNFQPLTEKLLKEIVINIVKHSKAFKNFENQSDVKSFILHALLETPLMRGRVSTLINDEKSIQALM